jgi:hypothetical protein
MGIALTRTGFSVGNRVHRCEGATEVACLSVIRFELAERGEAGYK